MQRLNISILTNQDENFIEDGTAAMFLATNPLNNQTGILKENGCMLGITNEDLREKLASIILNLCGVEAANVDLFIDDNNNKYCFSYNVLQNNQKHIELKTKNPNITENKEDIFNQYIKGISASIICLPGITKEQYENIKKRILEIHFMDLIIDHYDRKPDNYKIIYDSNNREYIPPIAYDYGVAFMPDARQKNGIFFYLSNEEVMSYMVKHHFEILKSLIKSIRTNLTDDKLKQILMQDEFQGLNPSLVYSQIKNRINQLENILLGYNYENQELLQNNTKLTM